MGLIFFLKIKLYTSKFESVNLWELILLCNKSRLIAICAEYTIVNLCGNQALLLLAML